MKNLKRAAPFLLLAAVLVLIDQALKTWVRGNIPLYGAKSFLPGLVELTYVQNTGAAFSILKDHTWLLALLSTLAAALLVWLLWRDFFPHLVGRLALALVLGGAVGNLIDRVLLGFVVDMFYLEFVRFAVFNVADIGVTFGGVFMCIFVLFLWKKVEREEGEP